MNIFTTLFSSKSARFGGIAVGAAVAIAALAGCAPTAAPAAQPAAATAVDSTPKPTVVMVHGAWSDASPFDAVGSQLREAGYTVVNFANPLRALSTDTSYLNSFLETRTEGPVVLVGHSYGGAVIGGAATTDADVKALVYLNAFVPEAGETILDLAAPTTSQPSTSPSSARSPTPPSASPPASRPGRPCRPGTSPAPKTTASTSTPSASWPSAPAPPSPNSRSATSPWSPTPTP
jgi:pimeloyl-ACP methyl ester carboxylesterase